MALRKEDQIDLILGVLAKHAAERGCLLTKIRLVKFLYLLDLFWAQAHGGQTFTGWPWAFVHYGPFCGESIDAIDRAVKYGFLAADDYESKHGDEDFRMFGPGYRVDDPDEADVKRLLPIYVASHLFGNVDRWCDDTYGLLDYVYFHTGPMRRAQPGDRLSFAKEVKIDYAALRPVKITPLSQDKKKALRSVLDKMKKEAAAAPRPVSSPALYDDVYVEALATLAGDETPVGVSGSASIVHDPPDDD